MCGIVGYLGSRPAAPILMEGLRRLDYRGYDNSGISTISRNRFDRRRAVGDVDNLQQEIDGRPVNGFSGVGHTRWATHGGDEVVNAHPHQLESVSVVHNGIIENFRDLRRELTASGRVFASETDTETVVVMCQDFLDRGCSPREAVANTLPRLRGSYALLFLFSQDDDLLIAATLESSLVIGHGDGEMFVASDEIALAGHTDTVTHLESGDMACVNRSSLEIIDRNGRKADRPRRKVEAMGGDSDRNGYAHYMAKEIFQQPDVLAGLIRRSVGEDGTFRLPEGLPDFRQIDRVVLVACGTANLACRIAAYWFEQLAGIPASAEIASEFRYRESVLDDRVLAVFVSQSGETADTRAALTHANSRGCPNIAILNRTPSSMAREASSCIEIHAGYEIGVASTKAFTCQLATLAMLACLAGRQRQCLSASQERELAGELRRLPAHIQAVLGKANTLKTIAKGIAASTSALFIGRGTMFPVALEGALKLKEISYIHAEGFASGELKHGPIALVDQDLPVVVLAPPGLLFEKVATNLEEVKARGGKVILVTSSARADDFGSKIWHRITVPEADPLVLPMLYTIPLQLLAYYTAVARGTNVDKPRNLAKSVTVE